MRLRKAFQMNIEGKKTKNKIGDAGEKVENSRAKSLSSGRGRFHKYG